MLWFKKKEKTPTKAHDYSKSLGCYYKLFRTAYKNCFDNVRVYERRQCSCGSYKDVCISSNEFLPSLYRPDIEEQNFIKELRSKGIKQEYELNLDTKLTSSRSDCFCG